MIKRYRFALAAFAMLATGLALAALPEKVGDQPMPSLAPLVKRAAPAVVNIRVSQTVESR